MNEQAIKRVDLGQLVDSYREAAVEHGKATELGDFGSANRAAHVVAAIHSELSRRGPGARECLKSLLSDREPAARLWAASHVLDLAPSKAAEVLEEIASGPSILGMSAATTLKEWRAGRLKFHRNE